MLSNPPATPSPAMTHSTIRAQFRPCQANQTNSACRQSQTIAKTSAPISTAWTESAEGVLPDCDSRTAASVSAYSASKLTAWYTIPTSDRISPAMIAPRPARTVPGRSMAGGGGGTGAPGAGPQPGGAGGHPEPGEGGAGW